MRFFILFFFLIAIASVSRADSQLWLGVDYQKFNYAEDLPAPKKSTESAAFAASMLKYRYFWSEKSYLQVLYSNANSVNSSYEGTSLSGSSATLITADNPLKFTKYEVRFNFETTDSFSFFVGAGQKIWDRFLSGGSGYREIYSWMYLPVGFCYWISDSRDFFYGIEASALVMSNGKMKIITSETVSGGQDSEVTLGSKTGYRLSVPFHWQGSSLGFEFVPYAEQTEIGKSDLVTNTTLAPGAGQGVYEPDSKTLIYGFETGLTIKF